MLINTVVLVLRELLPWLVLMSLLLLQLPQQRSRFFMLLAGFGLPLLLLQALASASLASALDGQGLEMWYSLCYLSCCVCLMLFIARPPHLPWLVGAAIALLLVHGNNLWLYLWLYPRPDEDQQSLWLGVALGTGICLSIGVLLHHLVRELRHYLPVLGTTLLLLVAARQLMAALAMFQQMDWLNSEPLWDTRAWIAEDQAIGFLLNAMLGYEATPSLLQVLSYGVVLGVGAYLYRRGRFHG